MFQSARHCRLSTVDCRLLVVLALNLWAAAAARGDDPDPGLPRANALLREGKPKEARALLEPLARENPQSAPIQYALAQEAILERDLPRATKHLERTIEIDPGQLAINSLKVYLEKRPEDPRGLFNLAQAEEKKGNSAEALYAWRRFVAAAGKGDAEVKADIPRARERIKALEKEAKKSGAKKK